MSNSIFKTEEEEIDSQTGEEVTDQGEILEFSANVDEVAEEDTICDDDYSPTEEITDEAHAHDEDSQVNDSQFSHGPSHLMPIAPNTVIFKMPFIKDSSSANENENTRNEADEIENDKQLMEEVIESPAEDVPTFEAVSTINTETKETPSPVANATTPTLPHSAAVVNDPDYQQLIAELSTAVRSLKNLDQIESLNSKIEALYELNKILQLHGEVLAPLQNLEKLDKLNNLKKLDQLEGLKELASIQELKKLDNLSKLSHIDRISELSKLENLVELRSLEGLTHLQGLDKLESLAQLDKLEGLENLRLLDKLDETDFIAKVERLDKISILNKKMHVLFLGQLFGTFLEIVKFGCAAALVLFLISSQIGQKFTSSALTAVGFGSAAQTNLGLTLLQGEVEEPQFTEIIENTRKKIKADYHRAISIDNRLSLGERVNLISEVLDYNYRYKDINIQEETRQAVTQQILYSKNLVVSKIEFDISIATNQGRSAEVNKLKELKVLFLNGKYPQIIEKYKNQLETLESVKMATIVATLEMYLEDPKTLQQLIIL